MKNLKNLGLVILILFGFMTADAHINPNRNNKPANPDVKPTINYREDCLQPEEQKFQNINNVRARLTTGGDVWWDLSDGQYFVPQPPDGDLTRGVSSIFAGSVWIGGFDPAGNLKMCAGTYRSGGSFDFFTGPLDPVTGLTDAPICKAWDEFFIVYGDNVRAAAAEFDQNGGSISCDSVRDGLRYWPGRGNPHWLEKYEFELPNTGQGLGSYWDEDQNGIYTPCGGDIPTINIRGCEPTSRKQAIELVPDEMFFWIYNDAGGAHTETQGDQVQMEIQVQSFAYATNDEINDMTFQNYKLINRATTNIQDCYFAMWVDPDLGCSVDDFVGCDVERSLAYVYNEDILDGSPGTDCDGGVNTYKDEVPILGVDYFRGPLAPVKVTDDDDPNGRLHVIKKSDDDFNELFEIGDTIYVVNLDPLSAEDPDLSVELGMSSFIYYNRGGLGADPRTVDPAGAQQYYNYLTGNWIDGTPLTFGGNGLNTAGGAEEVKFAFPSDPDDSSPTAWSMCSEDLPFGDRRTVQASGPFLLEQNAINELIIGAVWVPNLVYPCPDISRLQAADDLAQALFDNCFDITDGPDAPDVSMVELDRELILVLSNDSIKSNNAFLEYEELDLLAPSGVSDSTYVFEGYKVFQLVSGEVSTQELDDIEKARRVFQADIRNGVAELFNWQSTNNPLNGEPIWEYEMKVQGADQGLRNTIRITRDAFASGTDTRLVNHKEYFFMAVAYGYNSYADFDTDNPELTQRLPYLEGRGNIMAYTGVPRPIVYTQQNSNYGDGPIIARLAGEGVARNNVELLDSITVGGTLVSQDSELLANNRERIYYKRGAGPINVKIYNPLEVKAVRFELEMVGEQNTSIAGQGSSQPDNCQLEGDTKWKLTNLETNEVIESEGTISEINEQLIPDYGFSVDITQQPEPGTDNGEAALEASLRYADSSKPSWYLGVSDGGTSLGFAEGFSVPTLDFLKTGNNENDGGLDPGGAFSNLGDGYFYPFFMTNFQDDPSGIPYVTPAYKDNNGHNALRNTFGMYTLNNVDIVMTSDKSKWSRCVVVETANEGHKENTNYRTEGNVSQLDLRAAPSVDKSGNPDGDGTGMGWFPGYALDVETGKRLNIFFGENSMYNQDSMHRYDINAPVGADMLFNPSDQEIIIPIAEQEALWHLMLGGGHMMYVTRQKYDGCEQMRSDLEGPCNTVCAKKFKALQYVTWTSIAMCAPGFEMNSIEDGLVPNDVRIKLRAANSYSKERTPQYGVNIALSCNVSGGLPKYELDFESAAPAELAEEDYEGALANVNAVPNPYYAYSSYETSQFTNTIKITNLPAKAVVSIYSIDGKFIRQFNRSEVVRAQTGANPGVVNSQVYPDLEWDLENYAGIPVASGVYLIHIAATELNEERTIKWFGVHRKFDPKGL